MIINLPKHVLLLLPITLLIHSSVAYSSNFSHDASNNHSTDNHSKDIRIAVDETQKKEATLIEQKLKNTKQDFSMQKKKKTALEAQLKELEQQVQQLIKENAEKDSRLKELNQQKR